jgi:hypothetical protein
MFLSTAFGQCMSLGRASVCTTCALHVGAWTERWGGEATGSEPMVKEGPNLGGNSPLPTSCAPLQQTLHKMAGKEALTGEVVRAAATNGVNGGNGVQAEEYLPSSVP